MPAPSNSTNEFNDCVAGFFESFNDSPYTQQSSDEEDFVGEINRNYMLPNNATQLIVNNEQITDEMLRQIANILHINYSTRNQTAAYLVNWLISNHNDSPEARLSSERSELIDAERYYLNFYPNNYHSPRGRVESRRASQQLRSIDNILSQLIINEQSTGDLMLYPLVCIILTEGWVD